jgi:hypothetical protein
MEPVMMFKIKLKTNLEPSENFNTGYSEGWKLSFSIFINLLKVYKTTY